MHATCDIYASQFQKCVVVMLGPSGAWEEAESIPFHGVEERSLVGLLHLGSDLTHYLGDHGSRHWEVQWASVGISGLQWAAVAGWVEPTFKCLTLKPPTPLVDRYVGQHGSHRTPTRPP